eukprot:TRINITY_DN3449_c1_g1_i3.p1 TRINITY_DN3449_c1_g1~~TRINITY_DN3449_c1_g1_i3.p1  ORF type:complete len:101 (-),score=11.65 TRINITY_DN3449_c1_g1_i3:723-1025(-)
MIFNEVVQNSHFAAVIFRCLKWNSLFHSEACFCLWERLGKMVFPTLGSISTKMEEYVKTDTVENEGKNEKSIVPGKRFRFLGKLLLTNYSRSRLSFMHWI